MNNIRTAVLFTAGAVLFAVLNVFMPERSVPDAPGDNLFFPDALKVNSFEITRMHRNGEKVVLRRTDEWRLEKPFAARVDQAKVLSLLDTVVYSRVKDVLTKRELHQAGRTIADFGLDRPRMECTVSSENGKSRRVLFGSETPSGDGVYTIAGSEGAEGVFVTPLSVFDALSTDVNDFRKRSLADFEPSDIVSIDIRRGSELLRLRRVSGRWEFVSPLTGAASGRNIEQFLEDISLVQATGFVWPSVFTQQESTKPSDSILAAYSLDAENAVTVTLRAADGRNMQILFGKESADGFVYAFSPLSESVVVVPEKIRASALAEIPVFKDDRLFPCEEKDVRTVTVDFSGERVALAVDASGQWRIDSPVSAPADSDRVKALVSRIVSFKRADARTQGAGVGIGPGFQRVIVEPDKLLGGSSLADFRSRAMIALPAEDVRRIISRRRGAVTETVLYNSGRSAWENADGRDGRKVSEESLRRLLSVVSDLKAESVASLKASGDEMRRYGLEDPFCSISFDSRGEGRIRTNLLIGSPTESQGRYVSLGTSEEVFVIGRSDAESLTASLFGDAENEK